MTADLAPYRCDAAEARELTEQIKGSVEKTWRLLLNAHEWNAWAALGYDTWESYVRAEFGIGRSRSYQLLDQGRVVREIEAAVSTNVDIKEAQARELAPLLDRPDELRDAWEQANEQADGKPTAATIRNIVRPQSSPPPSDLAATSGAPAHGVSPAACGGEPTSIDHRTGEVPPPEPGGATPEAPAALTPAGAPEPEPEPDPVAAARAEVSRQPVVVTNKAIDRLRTARQTFEAAGSPADVMADLANSTSDTDNTGFWLAELEAALPVLNGLLVALRRRNLRSVKP
jgi:hypothetical protein